MKNSTQRSFKMWPLQPLPSPKGRSLCSMCYFSSTVPVMLMQIIRQTWTMVPTDFKASWSKSFELSDDASLIFLELWCRPLSVHPSCFPSSPVSSLTPERLEIVATEPGTPGPFPSLHTGASLDWDLILHSLTNKTDRSKKTMCACGQRMNKHPLIPFSDKRMSFLYVCAKK